MVRIFSSIYYLFIYVCFILGEKAYKICRLSYIMVFPSNVNITSYIFLIPERTLVLRQVKNTRQNGFPNLGYFTSRCLGLIVWRLVLRPSPTSSRKHAAFVHLDVSYGRSVCHSPGKNSVCTYHFRTLVRLYIHEIVKIPTH